MHPNDRSGGEIRTPSSPKTVPLILSDEHRDAIREDCMSGLQSVLDDLRTPDRLPDPGAAAREGEVFRRLLEALDREEIVVPDEEMRTRFERLAESYETNENVEDIVNARDALRLLLGILDGSREEGEGVRSPGSRWLDGDDEDCRREILSLLLSESPHCLEFRRPGRGAGGRPREPAGKKRPQGRGHGPSRRGPGSSSARGARADALGPPDGRARFRHRLMDDFDTRVAWQLGRRVKRRRNFLDLSQEALADRAGIHRTQISMYEHGERMPLVSTLIKLASALEVSVDQLVVGIDWPVPGPPLVDLRALEFDE